MHAPSIESEHPVQVVVAFDFSATAEHALARAVAVAARSPKHVLHVVAVLDPQDPVPALGGIPATYEAADELHGLALARVSAAFEACPTAGEVQFFVHARIGKAAEQILGVAAEVGADLLFIGSHGKTGVERLLLGSVSERVVREARCPVIVARPKTYADVDLMKVIKYDHARAPHRAPHVYSYSNRQVILRPNEWPLS